jgi:outer membrane protein assembly factor BamB
VAAVTVALVALVTAITVGPGAAAGSDERRPPYGPGWPAVHADARNSDYAPVRAGSDLSLAWRRHLDGSISIRGFDWTINLGPTVSADGQVHLTSTVAGCHMQALDGRSGRTRWCATGLDHFAVTSSPLLDRRGRSYVADGRAMHAFTTDGRELWSTPIRGVPFSAQFTPRGRVLLITHIGVVYVLDRRNGIPVMPPYELVPGATWDRAQGVWACAQGVAGCAVANTPAVDERTGRVFFTFLPPGAARAETRAMRIIERGPRPRLEPLWANDSLPFGSASSPDLSKDGRRLYVTDNAGSLHAIDARSGRELWSHPIGGASAGSPSTSPRSLVMPAGGAAIPLQAVQDRGDRGATAWRLDGVVNRGVATQAAGNRAYATVARSPLETDLLVVDTRSGAILDREPLPGRSRFTVGTTIGPDGTVLVPTIGGDLFAFRR